MKLKKKWYYKKFEFNKEKRGEGIYELSVTIQYRFIYVLWLVFKKYIKAKEWRKLR